MAFVRDCLDGFILAACMELLCINTFDEKPKREKLPDLLKLQPKKEQYDWIKQLSMEILTSFVFLAEGMVADTLYYMHIFRVIYRLESIR